MLCVRRLHTELTERGLKTPRTARTPEKPVALSHLNRLLRSRYYLGEVRYEGVWYPGNHEPLVDLETWTRVQAALDAHDRSGEKSRKHEHYLKGTIWCATCGARLCVANNRGKMGKIYPYFMCLGRQRDPSSCTQRAVPIDLAVDAVERCHGRYRLTRAEAERLRGIIVEQLEEKEAAAAADSLEQSRTLQRVSDERQKLLQAHYAGAVPVDLLRSEMDRLERERDQAERRLAMAATEYAEVEAVLGAALRLATDCASIYPTAPPAVRRLINQALFEKLFLGFDEGVAAETTDLFTILFDPETPDRLVRSAAAQRDAGSAKTEERQRRRSADAGPAPLVDVSSSETHLVHLTAHLLNSRERLERAANAIDRPVPKRAKAASEYLRRLDP